jgi:hypothetical protein
MNRLIIAYLRARAVIAIALATLAHKAQATADRIDSATDAAAERRGISVEQFHPAYD